MVYGDISGACGSMAATDAQLRGRVVQYVRRLYNCAHRSSYLHRFDTATGHDTRVNPPPLRRAFGGAHAMASDGRDTYWLHSNHTTDTETSPGTCDRGCRIIRSKGLCFAPRRSQDPRASDGAENSTS